jgi:hypothetical protein
MTNQELVQSIQERIDIFETLAKHSDSLRMSEVVTLLKQIKKDAETVRGEEVAQGSAPMCPMCNAPVDPACNCARGIDAAEASERGRGAAAAAADQERH